ncbi:hypothetical protein UlMin_038151 [Ulmus minor]
MEASNPSVLPFSSELFAFRLQKSLRTRDISGGKLIHSLIIKSGLHLGVFLMNMGCFNNAIGMFVKMISDNVPITQFMITNVLASCAAIGALDVGKKVHSFVAKHGLSSYVSVANSLPNMYAKSGDSSLKPDKFTLASVLSACGNLEKLELGRQIHAQIIRNASDTSVSVGNALISMYAKSGGVEIARKILLHRGSSRLNVIAFTALLDGYIKLGDVKPARQIFDSASVSNALITMYAKGGSISSAKQVYNLMQQKRNPVSWTSMIIALAQHGLGEEAIELFESMLTLSVKPDHITFVGVLSGCTHVGWVEQGRKYYNLMRNVHKIEPTLSHYACMIDLFVRAGLLQEAFDFIQSMPIEPDVIAWGSLLSSCKVHKNVDMAKVAAERLLIIDPGNSGAYSALANLYSACGKWEDAARIRKSMKVKGIRNTVHVFGVEDGTHPQKDAIYKMMEKIWKEIKKMGFIPNTESVFLKALTLAVLL